MINIRLKQLIVTLFCIIVMTCVPGVHARAQHKPTAGTRNAAAVAENAPGLSPAARELLRKLQSLDQAYGKMTKDFIVKGSMTMTDGADPQSNLNHLPFEYCVKGSELYYRNGDTEVINGQGLYLVIDHTSKKIMIGRQKKIVNKLSIPSVNDMIKALNSEQYQLLGHTTGGDQTITLSNEHHVSCKEITMSYDTVKRQIKHLYFRYTNLSAPASRSMERVVSVDISRWDGKADMDAYVKPAEVAYSTPAGWKLRKKYLDYELIIT